MELKLDMLTVCRTCLQDGDAQMISIYEVDEEKNKDGLSLSEKIEDFTGIQVSPYGLWKKYISNL